MTIFYPRNGFIHSYVIFRMSSFLFVAFPTSIAACMEELAFSLFWTNFLSVCSCSTARVMWEHLQQQQNVAVKTSTTLSHGSSEWAQSGRKSQDRNTGGRHATFLFWKKFISRMTSSKMTIGAPTPTSTEHPANDKLNTKSGRRKKQSVM